MSNSLKSVLEQVHQLSKTEQLALVELIVRMLRESKVNDVQLSSEWEAELDKRDTLLDEGKMPLYSYEEIKKRIINRNKSA